MKETRELIKIQKNGTKVWKVTGACDRCGGTGYYAIGVRNGQLVLSPVDHGVCFKCNGSGIGTWTEKELSPEAQAKQEADLKAEKERQAAVALAEEIDECHRQALIENKWFDQRTAEAKASDYQGEIGDKITVKIVNFKEVQYETHYEWRHMIKYIHIMKDEQGNTYVWNTEHSLGYYVEADEKHCSLIDKKGRCWNWHGIDENEEFIITGTVKEHKEYDRVKQTVLTRCKIKATN